MQITGTYSNYLNLNTLLSPLGVKGSGDLVMSVFSASMGNLTSKINNQIFSKESAIAANQLYNEALNLSSKTTKLTQADINSVFNGRTATSSNSNVLTASAYDALSQDTGAAEATYDISVSQMAQSQENTGVELNKADASVVGLGTNTFNININGQDNELSIEVVDGDTNEAVLQKIETAFNDAGLGADLIIQAWPVPFRFLTFQGTLLLRAELEASQPSLKTPYIQLMKQSIPLVPIRSIWMMVWLQLIWKALVRRP
jgi:flagellar hook-associated protein 2